MSAELLRRTLGASAETKRAAAEVLSEGFGRACEALAARLRAQGCLFACGNGGSMADALHLVGEMVGRFAYDRPAIRSVALGCNPASLTAIANDYSYAEALRREADALIEPGDALIAISTSGEAPNVVSVARLAAERGAYVLGLTGKDGGTLLSVCHETLVVPSHSTPRIQEVHIVVIHALCEYLEATLCPQGGDS